MHWSFVISFLHVFNRPLLYFHVPQSILICAVSCGVLAWNSNTASVLCRECF